MKAIAILLAFVPLISLAQPLIQFNEERLQTDQRLMLGLGSWAVTNFIVSGIGWATSPVGEAHSFHQMNVIWNTINLGLAIPGYIKATNEIPSDNLAETIRAQRKTEQIFLVNTCLDVAYVSSGFLLRSLAEMNPLKRDQYNGFGDGMILQGGFLFLFDLSAYTIHKLHAKRGITRTGQTLGLSSTGLGLRWNFGTQPFARNHLFL